MIRVLGIDPGSVITGYGVIDTDGIRSFHVAHGHLRIAGDDLPEKLGFIYHEISKLVEQYKPDEAGIEEVFMSNNAMSALKLGQARGAAICAMVQHLLIYMEEQLRIIIAGMMQHNNQVLLQPIYALAGTE